LTKIELKAGSTFSYAGTVSNLDASTAWSALSTLRNKTTKAEITPGIIVTLAKASDFSSTQNWVITLFAPSVSTTGWLAQLLSAKGEAEFDIKFFNTAAPDPVIKSDTVDLKICPAVSQ